MFDASKVTSKAPQCVKTLYTPLLPNLIVIHTPSLYTCGLSAAPNQRFTRANDKLCATAPYLETDAKTEKSSRSVLTRIPLWPNFVTACSAMLFTSGITSIAALKSVIKTTTDLMLA